MRRSVFLLGFPNRSEKKDGPCHRRKSTAISFPSSSHFCLSPALPRKRPPQRRLAGKNQIAQICCTTHALFGKVWVLILREKREPRRLWRLLLWQGNNWRRERPNFNPLPPPSSSPAGKVAKETPPSLLRCVRSRLPFSYFLSSENGRWLAKKPLSPFAPLSFSSYCFFSPSPLCRAECGGTANK